MNIVIVVLTVLCAALGTLGIYCCLIAGGKEIEKENFKKSQNKVLKELKEKKDSFDKEITQEHLIKREELRVALEQLTNDYNKEKENFQQKSDELVQDYRRRRQQIEIMDREAAQRRNQEQAEQISEETKHFQNQLNSLEADYKVKKDALDKDFLAFSEQISIQKEALSNEIQRYEEKQKEIIARFKLDEERKQQVDFYRVQLNEIERADIEKLKTLALTFSKQEVIYKLIYDVYYKARIEEMFKRVLGDSKDDGGIYKITNITNQKVYIGKTSASFLSRWRTHAKRGCNIERIKGQLYDAMWNEGLENFMWEIVEVCPKEEQTEKEKYWTKYYHSDEYGYNQRVG